MPDQPAGAPAVLEHHRERGHGGRLPPVEPTLDPFETIDDLLVRCVLGCHFLLADEERRERGREEPEDA